MFHISSQPTYLFFQYYRCVHNKKIEFKCRPGTAWNQKMMTCDWPENIEKENCVYKK